MRVGVIVEGESEYTALPVLLQKVRDTCDITALKVIKAVITPDAPVKTVARQCHDRVVQQANRGADRILVVLDREDRTDCCGTSASEIQEAIRRHSGVEVCVVLKDRKFENWVIADVDALDVQRARFRVTPAIRRQIEPNRADSIDAERLLHQIVIGGSYSKVRDSKQTLERAQPNRVARNSRSFRRLMRCLGHPEYVGQSRDPA